MGTQKWVTTLITKQEYKIMPPLITQNTNDFALITQSTNNDFAKQEYKIMPPLFWVINLSIYIL